MQDLLFEWKKMTESISQKVKLNQMHKERNEHKRCILYQPFHLLGNMQISTQRYTTPKYTIAFLGR